MREEHGRASASAGRRRSGRKPRTPSQRQNPENNSTSTQTNRAMESPKEFLARHRRLKYLAAMQTCNSTMRVREDPKSIFRLICAGAKLLNEQAGKF
jgi:hypothetical protein